jgi:hypothetical protein
VSETWHKLAYFLALVKSRDVPESNWSFTGSVGAVVMRLQVGLEAEIGKGLLDENSAR